MSESLNEKLKPVYFTPEHQAVLDLLGEDMCEKLGVILNGTPFKISPLTIYLRNKRTAELLNSTELTFAQIAHKEKITRKSVYNLNRSIKTTQPLK